MRTHLLRFFYPYRLFGIGFVLINLLILNGFIPEDFSPDINMKQKGLVSKISVTRPFLSLPSPNPRVRRDPIKGRIGRSLL